MNALVCLFTRPLNTLQTYAGDTSLPGGHGMSEEEDKTIEDTSVSSTINSQHFFRLNDIILQRRKAFEEVYRILSRSNC